MMIMHLIVICGCLDDMRDLGRLISIKDVNRMRRARGDLLRIFGVNSQRWGLLLNNLSVNEFLLLNLTQTIIRISKYYEVY